MNTNVSILAEIPEYLHLSMQGYLGGNPDWDQDRVFSAALSLFLLQNTVENSPEASLNYRRAARVYLETLFRNEVETPPVGSNAFEDFSPVNDDKIQDEPAETIAPLPMIEPPVHTEAPRILDPRNAHDPQDPQDHVNAA